MPGANSGLLSPAHIGRGGSSQLAELLTRDCAALLQDFEILIDDDTGPTPAPASASKPAAAGGPAAPGGFPKPPAAPGAPAAARLGSSHLQYVRPGLEPQGSLGSGLNPALNPHAAHPPPPGAMMPPGMDMSRQGSAMSGLGSNAASLGGPMASVGTQQQYSLPLAGVLPGPPAVPGPRPPPGGPRPPTGDLLPAAEGSSRCG